METSGLTERDPIQLSIKNAAVADLHHVSLLHFYRRNQIDERVQGAVKNHFVILLQVANCTFRFPGNRIISASGLFQNLQRRGQVLLYQDTKVFRANEDLSETANYHKGKKLIRSR